jgi:hypothetical protein
MSKIFLILLIVFSVLAIGELGYCWTGNGHVGYLHGIPIAILEILFCVLGLVLYSEKGILFETLAYCFFAGMLLFCILIKFILEFKNNGFDYLYVANNGGHVNLFFWSCFVVSIIISIILSIKRIEKLDDM